jgi:hypothetical protein
MALKNKYFTKNLVFFFLILTTIGLLSGCATLPPADDIDNPVVDEPTPTGPGEDPKEPELKDPETPTNTTTPNPKEPDLKEPTTNNTESETPTNTTTPDPKEPDLKEPTTNNTESETPKPHLRTFYVSNSGDDSNDGLSPQTPWRTISKVNSVNFLPGDAILFKRGDLWHNQRLKIQSGSKEHHITYSAYGEGKKPEFNGIIEVPGWTIPGNWVDMGNNVWRISPSGWHDLHHGRLWIDGVEKERSRYAAEGVGITSKYPWQRTKGSKDLYLYSEGNPSTTYSSLKLAHRTDFLQILITQNISHSVT